MKKQTNELSLIWVDSEYNLTNPKGLKCMSLEKGIGSLKWTKKILTKRQKCFLYDPSVISIFNDDGSPNKEMIDDLVRSAERLIL